jgi:SagB-type dehydrogenase family enzyme
VVVALLECVEARDASRLAGDLGRKLGRPASEMCSLIERLISMEIVVPAEMRSDRLALGERVGRDWHIHGWSEAADYHFATFDYTFVDYRPGAGGASHDRAVMREYNALEADRDRIKRYPDAVDRCPLPEPSSHILPADVENAFGCSAGSSESLAAVTLAPVLSMAVGVLSEFSARPPALPFLHRSSPSGGARHPVETYVCAVDVEGWGSGWYHVCPRPLELERLTAGRLDDGMLRQMFPACAAAWAGTPRAVVVLTAIFERNMYRYREPRTFRTVHMDVGHVAATVQACATAMGMRTCISTGDDADTIEGMLGLHWLEEAYMMSVALA